MGSTIRTGPSLSLSNRENEESERSYQFSGEMYNYFNLAIDSKSDMVEEGNNKASHQNGNDLDNCINLIKSNRIIKGIEVGFDLY
jgi:hypothetical protein